MEFVGFLSAHLPALGEDWWKKHIEDRLSFQQQRMVRERGLTTLEQLDFAALLRVLDQNWCELSQVLNLPREGRTWVRELQTVRNRWAHLSAQTTAADDIYRDADTLGRVLDMLGAAPASVEAIEAKKTTVLAEMKIARGAAVGPQAPTAGSSERADGETAADDGAVSSGCPATMFRIGELVALRSDPGLPTCNIPGGAFGRAPTSTTCGFTT